MSDTVIFSIGAVIFALTLSGCLMAGGLWFERLAAAEHADGIGETEITAPD